MIDPETQHDWSEPPGPTIGYIPICHRCMAKKSDQDRAEALCPGASVGVDSSSSVEG